MHTNIHKIREEQHLSVPFVAKLLAVSSEEYEAIEESKLKDIDSNILKRLSKVFGVSLSDFKVNFVTPKISIQGLSRTYQAPTEKDNIQLQKLSYYRERDRLLNGN